MQLVGGSSVLQKISTHSTRVNKMRQDLKIKNNSPGCRATADERGDFSNGVARAAAFSPNLIAST